MATFKRFEDIPVWQKSRVFASKASELIHRTELVKYFKLRDQMLGSSGSVMDNIAEGFERSGNKELIQFLYYSKGSSGEFRSQLYRVLDAGFIGKDDFSILMNESEIISKELHRFIQYLEKSNLAGPKYRYR